MLLKSITLFVICNYVTEILSINVLKFYVNHKPLYRAVILYIYVTCAR